MLGALRRVARRQAAGSSVPGRVQRVPPVVGRMPVAPVERVPMAIERVLPAGEPAVR
jgi:hypothetical protein